MRIVQPELAAMQSCDRGRQAEPKAGTGLAAARIEPHETLDRMPAVAFRNSDAVIGDAQEHLVGVAPGLDQDLLGVQADDRA